MYGVGDLKAVAADVDGDGKYELVMLRVGWAAKYNYNVLIPRDTITYGEWKSYLHIWRHDQKLQMKYDKQIAEFDVLYNSPSTFRTRYLYDDGSTREKTTSNTFTDQSFQIIAGVLSGTSTNDRPCQDIVVSKASYLGGNNGHTDCWIKVISPVLDNDGKLKEFKTTDITSFKSKESSIGLGTGDFVGDGIILKNPIHTMVEGNRVYTSIIQAPPYHVDYIPLPWEKTGKPKLANFSYVPDTQVNYTRTQANTNKKDLSSSSQSQTNFKADGALGVSAGIPFFQDPATKYAPRHSLYVEGSFNRVAKDIDTKLESAADTVKTTINMGAGRMDSVMAYQTRKHIWRYPIEPMPKWYSVRSKDIKANDHISYTVTMNEQPVLYQGNLQEYNARHEEGNLFSYPTKMDNIPDFTNANTKVLSDRATRLFGATDFNYTLAIDKVVTNGTESVNDVNKSVGLDVTYMFGDCKLGTSGFKLHAGGEYAWGDVNKKSFTKTYSKGDTISIKYSDPSTSNIKIKDGLAGSIDDVTFGTAFQAYINPQGLMKMGFAVDLSSGGTAAPLLWRESVYNVSADPSFVLPYKFTLLNGTWIANSDILRATQARGVLLYSASDTSKLLDATFLEAGKSYQISFPIYNASFVNVPNFKVRLSYLNYKDRKNLIPLTKASDLSTEQTKQTSENTRSSGSGCEIGFLSGMLSLGIALIIAKRKM